MRHRSWLEHLRDAWLPGDFVMGFWRWVWVGFHRAFAIGLIGAAIQEGVIVYGIVIVTLWWTIEVAFVTYFYKTEKRLLWEYEHYGSDVSS